MHARIASRLREEAGTSADDDVRLLGGDARCFPVKWPVLRFLHTNFRTRVYEERLMRNGSAIVVKLVCKITFGTAVVMMFKPESGALA